MSRARDLADSADLSFDSGTLVIDSDNDRVGIGTASPSSPLTVDTGAGTFEVKAKGSGSVTLASDASLTYFGSTHEFYNTDGTTQYAVINQNGNVGIGTASPVNIASGYTNLTIDGTGESNRGGVLSLSKNDTEIGRLVTFGAAGSETLAIQNVQNKSIVFRSTGSDDVTLDASGNLLVGKTSTDDFTIAGTQIDEDGFIAVTRDGSVTGIFNRETSDGDILQFRKDNSTVGSIGTQPTNNVYFAASSGCGVRFNSSAALPCDGSGATADGSKNLGQSSVRWQDLYLSGGVYLGGTGSANHLDDYEEGTWTPTLGGTWTSNPTGVSGQYVKIGRIVWVRVGWTGGSKSSATSAHFASLPFTPDTQATGSVSNVSVADYGNSLADGGSRIFLTNNSFSALTFTTICYRTS